jgi:hypothetical protein
MNYNLLSTKTDVVGFPPLQLRYGHVTLLKLRADEQKYLYLKVIKYPHILSVDFTHQTRWGRDPLQRLLVDQQLNKFLPLYANWKFILCE